jgi:hypothetical protein
MRCKWVCKNFCGQFSGCACTNFSIGAGPSFTGSGKALLLCIKVQALLFRSHARAGHAMHTRRSNSLQDVKLSGATKLDAAAPVSNLSNVLRIVPPQDKSHLQRSPDPSVREEYERERVERASLAQNIRLSHNQLQASYRDALRRGIALAVCGVDVAAAFVTLTMSMN